MASMDTITRLINEHGRINVARAVGVTSPATYRWQRQRISAERAKMLAEAYGVELWQLRPDLWTPPTDKG